MARYRNGYRMMWDKAGRYVRRLKYFPEVGSCDSNNQMKGVMPALPGECRLSGKQAATILEKCADHPDTKDS